MPGITIQYLQSYIKAKDLSPNEAHCFLKLIEEVGELAEAIRKSPPPATPESIKGTVEEELWDVLYYILAIANWRGIDLETWIPIKEKINNAKYKDQITFSPPNP